MKFLSLYQEKKSLQFSFFFAFCFLVFLPKANAGFFSWVKNKAVIENGFPTQNSKDVLTDKEYVPAIKNNIPTKIRTSESSTECLPSLVNSTTASGFANGFSIAMPPPGATGDLLVAVIAVNSVYGVNTPAGWSLMPGDGSNYSPYLWVFYKTVDGTESATFDFNANLPLWSVQMAGTILQYTNVSLDKRVKLFADGAFFAQYMQMGPPGYTDGHLGKWLTEPDMLQQHMKKFWAAGFSLHIHVNGDLGADVVLNGGEV